MDNTLTLYVVANSVEEALREARDGMGFATLGKAKDNIHFNRPDGRVYKTVITVEEV